MTSNRIKTVFVVEHDPGDLAWVAGQLVPHPRVVAMSGDKRRLLMAAQLAQATVPKPFAVAALIGAMEEDDQLPS